MELAERSDDLKRKKEFEEIIKKLLCMLVAAMLMTIEGSLQLILSTEYHQTLQMGGTLI